MNIKSLPSKYVLKRWTRAARSGTVQDNHGRNVIENPRLDEMLCYKDMTRKFLNMALRAASHPGCTLLVNNTLDTLSKQVEEEINANTDTTVPVTTPTNVSPPPNDLMSAARLKKKEVETKTSKRKKVGSTRCTSLERREVRKRKLLQRYVITQHIFDSLSLCSMGNCSILFLLFEGTRNCKERR
jgi:zinc finger SWIM domain-containing protein 3